MKLIIFLIVINIIGFVLPLIEVRVWRSKSNFVRIIIALLGGSLGLLLSMALFDPKAEKEDMLSRVFAVCMLVIQVMAVLILKSSHGGELSFGFVGFFARHRAFSVYLAAVNLAAFGAFALDKLKAVKNKWRIKVATLMGLAAMGGSVGALLGMYILRHKTRQACFTVGIPLILITQLTVLFYAVNMGW